MMEEMEMLVENRLAHYEKQWRYQAYTYVGLSTGLLASSLHFSPAYIISTCEKYINAEVLRDDNESFPMY